MTLSYFVTLYKNAIYGVKQVRNGRKSRRRECDQTRTGILTLNKTGHPLSFTLHSSLNF